MPVINDLPNGSTGTETVLWTNSAPTSSFSAQTVTLSDVATNYDRLKIVYYLSDGNQPEGSAEYDMGNAAAYLNTTPNLKMCFGMITSSNYINIRYCHFSSNAYTGLYISAAYRAGSTNSGTNTAIPYQIIGVKL